MNNRNVTIAIVIIIAAALLWYFAPWRAWQGASTGSTPPAVTAPK